jgi:hypothetical protein
MKAAASLFGMDSTMVDSAATLGLFVPTDSGCIKEMPLEEELDLSWFAPAEDLRQPPDEAIPAILTSLFQVFADPNIVQHENGNYDSLPLQQVIDSILAGVWAPQCAGISKTAARIVNTHSQNLRCMSVETNYPEHTLNILSFESDGRTFAMAADFQNGFLFPVNPTNGSPYSVEQLHEGAFDDNNFFWLPPEMAHRKRNLLFTALPCNFLPDSLERYHRASKDSPYKYERLSFSFHRHFWFDLKTIDMALFRQELLTVLRATTVTKSDEF